MIRYCDEDNETTQTNPSVNNYVTKEGDVFILGKFDDSISQYVVPALLKRIAEVKDTPNPNINIYINSTGGYCHVLYSLLTIIGLAKEQGVHITTVNMGMAYSCGAFLFIMGDDKLMYKYSDVLFHLGSQGASVHTMKQIDRTEKQWRRHFSNIIELIKNHTNMSEDMIKKELEDDSYFLDAQTCVKYGVATNIIDENYKPVTPILEIKDGETYTFDGTNISFTAKVKEKKEKKSTTKSSKKSSAKSSKNKTIDKEEK